MEILPQKPKFWNPFACDVIKQYLCERAPVQPGENYTTPALPCTGPPAAPAGTARTVLLVNAGGPALCGFSEDSSTSPSEQPQAEAGLGMLADLPQSLHVKAPESAWCDMNLVCLSTLHMS